MAIPAWRKFQDEVGEYLELRAQKEPMFVDRYYDTTSATTFLPARPGDYFVLSRGHSILLEVKHSSVHSSLTSCFSSVVTDEQLAFHRLWLRAKGYPFYIFKSEVPDKDPVIQLWSSRDLIWIKDRIESTGKRQRLKIGYVIRQGSTIDSVLRNVWTEEENRRFVLL